MSGAVETGEADDDRGGSYASLILPLAVSILILTLFFFFAGADAAVEILTTAIATATVLGKFVVLRGLHEGGFLDSPFKLAFLVIYLDLMFASVAVYNVRLLHRLPRFGRKIQELQDNGEQILERNPWIRKMTFLGIILFVMFPLSGTGAIGGALFGRLLGLSRGRTMLGIAIGACFGSFLMAALAQFFGEKLKNFQDNPILVFGGIIAMGAAGIWLYRRAKAMSGQDE